MGPLVASSPGLRVPGAWSGLEAAAAAIAGSGTGAIVAEFGEPVPWHALAATHLISHTLGTAPRAA